MKIRNLKLNRPYLKQMYQTDPDLLDEMALPSLFHWNPLVRWITNTRLKKALSLIDLREHTAILDFGCGPGVLLLQLPKNHVTPIGVDLHLWPAEKYLGFHKRDDIKLIHADQWLAEVPDRSLDYIIATEVLEHVEDGEKYLIDFRSKMRDDGYLIVSLPTENTLYKLGRRIAGFSGHYHQKEIIQIEEIHQQAGLQMVKKISLPAPGMFSLYKLYLFKKIPSSVP